MTKHWIDDADHWICPICGFETSSPAKYEGCKCPKCGFQDDKDKAESERIKMAEIDEHLVFEMGYNKGFKDGIKGSIPKSEFKTYLEINLNRLKDRMKDRDEDNGGEPLNAVDRGYHLAYEHLCEEIDNLLKENKDSTPKSILEDIKTEIEQLPTSTCSETCRIRVNVDDFKENVLEIFDKYKAESEDKITE